MSSTVAAAEAGERDSDNTTLILYYSLHGAECQVMNMCHFMCRSLSGPGRASMENGVFRINDIENDREEIENSFLPEPCRLKCTSELSLAALLLRPLFKGLFHNILRKEKKKKNREKKKTR